jgi:putative ABC transport system ATP-binding protein
MVSGNGPILETKSLTRTIDANGKSKTIVDNVSYAFYPGRIFTIIGPSGAGKSSLLRLLNRLDEPTSGDVFFRDKPHCDYAPCDLRRNIAYLFQTPYLFPGTVRDNILYADSALTDERVKDLARQAHIDPDFIDNDTVNLSVGEKQRVALARLLALQPEIILLDEPTSALDPTHTEAIEDLIREIVATHGATAIMVSHNPEQAVRMGGEGLLLVGGKLVETGPVQKLVNQPQTELGRMYQARQLK